MLYDLLYVGNKEGYNLLWKDMQRHWPAAVLEDASDFIYLYRFSIELSDVSRDEYLLTALTNGFFDCSLAGIFY